MPRPSWLASTSSLLCGAPDVAAIRSVRRLYVEALKPLFGGLGPVGIVTISLAAGLGEELFFRGVLQPELGLVAASVIFGALHGGAWRAGRVDRRPGRTDHTGGPGTLAFGCWVAVMGRGACRVRCSGDELHQVGRGLRSDSPMNRASLAWTAALVLCAASAYGQQRPLETQDPESIGAGNIVIETGFAYLRQQSYPASGLRGHLTNVPILGFTFGVSDVAEFQIDHASLQHLSVTERFDAPNDSFLTFDGDSTSDFDDLVVGAKVRMLSETSRRPSFGFHFSTRLPNAGNESGLGLDMLAFHNSLLVGKTLGPVRVVGNVGLGIMGDPTNATRQNDVVLYGFSLTGGVSPSIEAVMEVNGWLNTRDGQVPPGTDSSGFARGGLRYTLRDGVRLDGAVVFGLHDRDATVGATVGLSWMFSGLQTE